MIDIITGTDGIEKLTGTESKKGGKIVAFVVLLCLIGAAAFGVYWFRTHYQRITAQVDPKASEQAVRDADVQWSKALQAHSVAALDSFFADDVTLLPANADMITNKTGAVKYWADHLTKDVDLSWKPMYVESAKSGDLVYEFGSYSMTTKPVKGAKGAPATDRGKYMTVWKSQADGSWKAEANTWNSDLPVKK